MLLIYTFHTFCLSSKIFDVAEQLCNITHDTLVIHGTGDALLPYGNAPLIVKKIRHAKLYSMEGLGHLFFVQNLQDTVQAISGFLSDKRKAAL